MHRKALVQLPSIAFRARYPTQGPSCIMTACEKERKDEPMALTHMAHGANIRGGGSAITKLRSPRLGSSRFEAEDELLL